MISVFNKTKKVVVDCFTSNPTAYEITPLTPANMHVPDWWQDIPPVKKAKTIEQAQNRLNPSTMKLCFGFIEFYKRGVIIPHWTDLILKVSKDGYQYAYSSGDEPGSHGPEQYNSAFKDYHNIKLTSPWMIKEKTGLSFIEMGATWNNDDLNLLILPGINRFDIHSQTNINIMLPIKEEEYTINLPLGRPLAHIIPLIQDVNIEYKNHLVTEAELLKYKNGNHRASFGTSFSVIKHLNKQKNKCPF